MEFEQMSEKTENSSKVPIKYPRNLIGTYFVLVATYKCKEMTNKKVTNGLNLRLQLTQTNSK